MNTIVILCDTLRRDHCGAYHQGRPLDEVFSSQQPHWTVPTPNMDRLAARGTTFNNAWCGSTPCMPARRDIYTGRYEFLERGWGPLEETDLDLPRQVSGEPNRSMQQMALDGNHISQLITDHFHLWEQGAGNYHMGYTGFDFVRGHESDNYRTDPIPAKDFEHYCFPKDKFSKVERHFHNMYFTRKEEADYCPAQVFTKAAKWLERNQSHEDFYLHLDCFAPHEPWDAPEELVKLFDPRGYDLPDMSIGEPYAKWRDAGLTESQLLAFQARYAAHVVLTDRWLGKLLDKMDELGLWENTMVVFCTDHGTYNGDHGRLGKLQTHEHDAVGHIPFIICHPQFGHGEQRNQLVQLVDIYPTVLAAIGRELPAHPKGLHGVNLLPVLENAQAPTREYAISGQFGCSISITDGQWILHQSPTDPSKQGNQPLNWYGHCLSRFLPFYELKDYVDGKRQAFCDSWSTPTWLSDKQNDPNELNNVVSENPETLARMQHALASELKRLNAPKEQLQRLGLNR